MDDGVGGTSRALLVTRNLPPLRGGMERLVLHVAQALSARYQLSVIGPNGCNAALPGNVQSIGVRHRPLIRFLAETAWAARQASQGRLALVFAGSGLTAPVAWWAARRSGARFAVYLHGLDIIAPSLIYRRLWLPFIRRADVVLVNSANTRRLALARGVPDKAVRVVHPGTDLPQPDPVARAVFRAAHQLGESPVMLSVGRLTPRKGLAEFVAGSLPRVLAEFPDAKLLVIGADATDAVRVASGSKSMLDAAEAAGVRGAIRVLPPCDDETLSMAYRAADVLVFPTRDVPGDVEGFGMVAIEAAAHGLPTVAFSSGGVPDAIVEDSSGSLVAPGDYAGFAAKIALWLGRGPSADTRASCYAVARQFEWRVFDDRLFAALGDIER